MNGKDAGFVVLALSKGEHSLAEVDVMIFQGDDFADTHSGHCQQAKQRTIRAWSQAVARLQTGRSLDQTQNLVGGIDVRLRTSHWTWQQVVWRDLRARVSCAQVSGKVTRHSKAVRSMCESDHDK
jgi:hypothetical protein